MFKFDEERFKNFISVHLYSKRYVILKLKYLWKFSLYAFWSCDVFIFIHLLSVCFYLSARYVFCSASRFRISLFMFCTYEFIFNSFCFGRKCLIRRMKSTNLVPLSDDELLDLFNLYRNPPILEKLKNLSTIPQSRRSLIHHWTIASILDSLRYDSINSLSRIAEINVSLFRALLVLSRRSDWWTSCAIRTSKSTSTRE